ncbi:thioesterase [Clostridium sp. AWRP]|uniref:thioesterase family protein n=1 Tax=Clostridium sp. AWRP TaxID=2212991 RepID=UPI000FD85484|nr:thioesterase [Clostridium sp. AWRP]AZV58615.1 thioesterase [Clostridium sp. AWRP]
MDFSKLFKVGSTYVSEYIVKPEDTANFIGNKGVVMLSTPAMIKYMEYTTLHIVDDVIPKNYRPVGTKIDVEHIKPIPANMKVIIKVTLISIEGKKLRYNIEAFNEKNCKVGFGIYEQQIVNLEQFLNR